MADQVAVSQVIVQVENETAPQVAVSQAVVQTEYQTTPQVAISQVVAQIEYLIQEQLPAAPTGVSATFGWSKNTVTWNPVTGADSYNLYWATSPGVTKENGTKISGATSGYVHGDLDDGTPYYYIVTAVNYAGEGPASTEAIGTPSGGTVQNVSAVGGNKQVSVSWSALTGAVSYRGYWSLGPGVTKETGTRVDCNEP